jgi:hypothetical protein
MKTKITRVLETWFKTNYTCINSHCMIVRKFCLCVLIPLSILLLLLCDKNDVFHSTNNKNLYESRQCRNNKLHAQICSGCLVRYVLIPMDGFLCVNNCQSIFYPALVLFEQGNCIDWILILLYTVPNRNVAFPAPLSHVASWASGT